MSQVLLPTDALTILNIVQASIDEKITYDYQLFQNGFILYRQGVKVQEYSGLINPTETLSVLLAALAKDKMIENNLKFEYNFVSQML